MRHANLAIRMTAPTIVPALVVALALLAGCKCEERPIPVLHDDAFAFIRDGQLTRDDAVIRLGVPAADFDGGRLLCFRVATTRNGRYCPRPLELKSLEGYWSTLRQPPLPNGGGSGYWFDLAIVLAFDDAGRLRRHEVVPTGTFETYSGAMPRY
jgi:hypothetical protein